MHRRIFAAIGTVALAAGFGMQAHGLDPIQGFYEGSFTSGWTDASIRAELVVWGEQDEVRTYRAVFHIAAEGEEPQRVQVEHLAASGTVEGESYGIALDGGLAGNYALEATIANGMFSGTLTEGDVEAAFELERVLRKPPTRGQAPPEGAIVLLDGTNLDAWIRWPEKWCLQGDGAMEVCGSNLATIEEFGDGHFHVEFSTPLLPNSRGQGRGNSGVYVMGRYEIQVLDSFGEPPSHDFCGGIYSIADPIVNATLPPGEWQTYDITLRAPRFDEDGEKVENGRITVLHNGELVHDDLELPHVTPGGVSGEEAAKGVLLLQDHGARVRFRNIWFKPSD